MTPGPAAERRFAEHSLQLPGNDTRPFTSNVSTVLLSALPLNLLGLFRACGSPRMFTPEACLRAVTARCPLSRMLLHQVPWSVDAVGCSSHCSCSAASVDRAAFDLGRLRLGLLRRGWCPPPCAAESRRPSAARPAFVELRVPRLARLSLAGPCLAQRSRRHPQPGVARTIAAPGLAREVFGAGI
jgi:hypothetical protein